MKIQKILKRFFDYNNDTQLINKILTATFFVFAGMIVNTNIFLYYILFFAGWILMFSKIIVEIPEPKSEGEKKF